MTQATRATPLILDVDTGVDDALALLYAVASPEVDLLAATCVMGNVGIDDVVRNTLAVLELAGRGEVEVARGASRPLVRDHAPFPVVHGDRGLGRADPPAAARTASDRDGRRVIVDTARARPGEVLLVATGPLTNVAMALAEEPGLPTLLRGFAIMGGAFDHLGNTTPRAEANIWVDPEAASAVFRGFAGAPEDRLPVCAGLDVTERVRMTHADVASVTAPGPRTPVGRFLREAVPFYIEFYERWGDPGGAAMHDPLALAIALDPGLATLVTTRVEVETDGTWTRGETVTDLRNLRGSPWPTGWEPEDNARVALDVDEAAFLDRFFDRLRALVEAQT
ncbi:MAG: nucleoside hydrolase [Actinomycetota bacterium]